MNFYDLCEAIESEKRLGKVVNQDVDSMSRDWHRKHIEKRPEATAFERIALQGMYSNKRDMQVVGMAINQNATNLMKWAALAQSTLPQKDAYQATAVAHSFKEVAQYAQLLSRSYMEMMMRVVPFLQKKLDTISPGTGLQAKDTMTTGAHRYSTISPMFAKDAVGNSKELRDDLDKLREDIGIGYDTGLVHNFIVTLETIKKIPQAAGLVEPVYVLLEKFMKSFHEYYGYAKSVFTRIASDKVQPTVSGPSPSVPVPQAAPQTAPTGQPAFSSHSRPTIDFKTPLW